MWLSEQWKMTFAQFWSMPKTCSPTALPNHSILQRVKRFQRYLKPKELIFDPPNKLWKKSILFLVPATPAIGLTINGNLLVGQRVESAKCDRKIVPKEIRESWGESSLRIRLMGRVRRGMVLASMINNHSNEETIPNHEPLFIRLSIHPLEPFLIIWKQKSERIRLDLLSPWGSFCESVRVSYKLWTYSLQVFRATN